MTRAIVFGGTGALGSAIVERLRADGWSVDVAGRHGGVGVSVDLSDPEWMSPLTPYDAVVWAQGANVTAGVLDADSDQMHELYDANVVFVTETLRQLVAGALLTSPARGVVVSSVWQITARSDKIAYVASKAALAGLIPAIAIDLASQAFAINGVLPGVIDTPMTRSNLSPEQLRHVESETLGGALATPGDVASAVTWLVDPRAAGINGQWIAVDNGWSAARSV
ncbi:MAG: SDR family NAD(P)-dependent oxidoreductase [Solirubrobacterales bacterium]